MITSCSAFELALDAIGKYFDPSRFAVVDAMHNLFLGIVQEHFEILGIRLEGETLLAAINLSISSIIYASEDNRAEKNEKSHLDMRGAYWSFPSHNNWLG